MLIDGTDTVIQQTPQLIAVYTWWAETDNTHAMLYTAEPRGRGVPWWTNVSILSEFLDFMS